MKYAIFISCLFLGTYSFGQDKHFSQFYASPMTLNPALAGAFSGTFRVGAIYRDQWRGALDNPFVTFSTSLDLRFEVGNNKRFPDAVGGGLLFFTDRVGGLDFNTNQMSFVGAYHKSLDRNSNQYLSAGFKFGFAQRNMNYKQLTFQDQFNDVDGFDLPSGEVQPRNNFSYADLAAGIHYTISPGSYTSYYAGVALHHFNRPDISFYKDDEEIASSKLYMKTVAHLGARFPTGDDVQLFPRIVTAIQGPAAEFTAGTNVRMNVNSHNSTAMHFGAWLRPVRSDEGFKMDAIIALAGVEYENVMFGLSYDMNLNSLSNYSKVHGAFELSVVYLGSYENETILCPTF